MRYESLGGGSMIHSWDARVVTGYLPAGADAPSKAELASSGGVGRGGFQVVLLSRPGGAAALVLPRDDAASIDGLSPQLFPLRAPCKER